MKKINVVLQFLSKKGALILGIIIGLLVAFVTAGVIVHAEESTEESGEKEHAGSITWTDIWTDGNNVGASIVQNVRGSGRICLYYTGGTDGTSNSGFILMSDKKFTVSAFSSIYNTTSIKESYLYNGKYQIYDAGSVTSFTSSGFLLFSDREKAFSYIDGTISEEDLRKYSNWDEWQKEQYESVYDKTIPVPASAYVSAITENNVSSIFKSDDAELTDFYSEHNVELHYDYSCEYLYQYLSKAQINSFNKDNSNVLYRGHLDYDTETYNNQKLLKTHGTCGEFYAVAEAGGNNTGTLNYLYTADDGPYTASGKVALENALSSVPPNYYDLYSQDLSFFSLEYHMQFVGVQIKIDTYYYDDTGAKVCSDSIYIRRFLFNTLNDAFETTYTRITHDDDGNDVFHSSYEQDANGNVTSGVNTLDTDNVLEHIKNGFGLTGKDGYLELLRYTFLGVPAYIWVLVATAMSVNIIVIVFKVLRGI